jgi:hypothetical protein
MREFIRIEREIRLINFLNKVESSAPPAHLARRWTKTLIELYLGHLRAEDSDWPNSKITISDVVLRTKGIWVHMYVHTPVSIRAERLIKKIIAGDYDGALEDAKRLKSNAEGKKIGSEIQSHHASQKHKSRAYEKLLEDLVKKKPVIGHKEMERVLRTHVGKGVIKRIDDSLGEIILEDGRDFKLSGLKDKIYKLRIKI